MAFEDFPNGLLYMSREPLPAHAPAPGWAEDPLNGALIFVCMVLCLVLIKDFFLLGKPVAGCLSRWKMNLELEHNIKLGRTRNHVALAGLLPLWLLCDRFDLLCDGRWLSLAAIIGFILLRYLMSMLVPHKQLSQEEWSAVRHTLYTIYLPALLLGLLCVCVWIFLRWEVLVLQILLYSIAGVFFLISLIREGQILSSHYPRFRAFLYLCALELVPASLFIAAAIIS